MTPSPPELAVRWGREASEKPRTINTRAGVAKRLTIPEVTHSVSAVTCEVTFILCKDSDGNLILLLPHPLPV